MMNRQTAISAGPLRKPITDRSRCSELPAISLQSELE